MDTRRETVLLRQRARSCWERGEGGVQGRGLVGGEEIEGHGGGGMGVEGEDRGRGQGAGSGRSRGRGRGGREGKEGGLG